MTFHGLLTALATPFRNGALDESAFRSLVRAQVAGGVDGLVPCGTTGESPTLSPEESERVVRWTLEEAGEVPVMAGVGGNDTASVVATAKRMEALGVKGVLATAPYYNKPTQEGLYRHFRAVAEAVSVEVCVYDVPGRSIVRVQPATLERLAEVPNITTVKDATADMAHATEVLRRTGDRFTLLSGDDFTVLPFLALGGHGTISVASNVVPAKMKALVVAGREGRLSDARVLNAELFPLFHALFQESNPIPLKAALAATGAMEDELRLPLSPLAERCREPLLAALRALDLLG
ncbi:MAG: 4-hydroxy-tetrahydrodipicolinate synthase [Myxococcales bacterium]|nr:4-hydroxy-tetrahydrodipicolinate synthase [Myxococcales bacterium]MCB9670155.1 4-hydroxy-tetrahydrodipicolinate synthase [Alphaproteobacteria bacterium]MCB9693596.1 4-hydroxy-tetrahydrodipicolinate synthase [Alphaproteobacteria bacterium]